MKRLCPGDTVKYVGKDPTWKHMLKKGEHMYISECQVCQGEVQNSTNVGAWFDADDFELVAEATPETLKLAEDYEELDEDDLR